MTNTLTVPNPTKPSDAQIQDHLFNTLEQIDSWLPDAEVTNTLSTLAFEYEYWNQNRRFGSIDGLLLVPGTSDLPDLRIPPELGYDPDEDVYTIHFTPPYITLDEEGNRLKDPMLIDEPKPDQKYSTIAHGLAGSLDYVTLVEAGLLPIPDHIVGVTNPTMARFAERAGLKTAASVVDNMAKDGPIDVEAADFQAMEDTLDDLLARFYTGGLDETESNSALMHILKVAAHAKATGERELYDRYINLANGLMLNTPTNNRRVVWGNYEDFRDSVIKFKNKFGDKIIKLAERDLANAPA